LHQHCPNNHHRLGGRIYTGFHLQTLLTHLLALLPILVLEEQRLELGGMLKLVGSEGMLDRVVKMGMMLMVVLLGTLGRVEWMGMLRLGMLGMLVKLLL